ncbi:MAG: class D sortase [Clostridium sp.]
MKKSIISTILIVLGILLIGFPTLENIYREKELDLLEVKWEESNNSTRKNTSGEAPQLSYKDRVVEGNLTIEKINLNMPILKGATEENLKISVASIYGENTIDGEGNYSIAGHRSRKYGKNFNRLNELSEGDIIKVTSQSKEYKYKVYNKLYVDPSNTEVLNTTKNKELTLITCDPVINPYRRLIIKAKLLS